MSVVLADGNVRVALTVKDHVHHRHATQWVEREAPDLATCPIAEDPDGCRVHHRQRRAAVGGGPATPA